MIAMGCAFRLSCTFVLVRAWHQNVMLVMELLKGGELFDRLSSVGPYSEKDAADQVRSIADALAFLHSKGIIHRDLKPENLILLDDTPDSPLRVCDFGLSRIIDVETPHNEADSAKTICGTWAYQAPEVKALAGHYDQSVDMWSLGVILFVILAAYHPFDVMGQATDDQIVEDARRGNWNFEDPEGDAWATISEGAKDLIANLIVVDATKASWAGVKAVKAAVARKGVRGDGKKKADSEKLDPNPVQIPTKCNTANALTNNTLAPPTFLSVPCRI